MSTCALAPRAVCTSSLVAGLTCVNYILYLYLYLRECVRVNPTTTSQSMGQAIVGRAMECSVRSEGSSIEGSAVQCVPTPVYSPWALVCAPIKAMLTHAWGAWSEFVLLEGNWSVCVLVAPEGRDRAAGVWSPEKNGVAACWT
jgi:hypothetical protein